MDKESKIEISKGTLDNSSKDHSLKGKSYYTIKSTQDITFDYILIKNYYVESISLYICVDFIFEPILLNFKLMPNGDSEEDSVKYFVINKKEMKYKDKAIDDITYKELRLYIFQDSKCWKEYKGDLIKIIKSSEEIKNEKIIYQTENGKNNKFIFKDKDKKTELLHDKDEIENNYFKFGNRNDGLEINSFL